MEWNYKSSLEKSNGYEDVINKLKKYTRDKYINSSQEEKENIINDIFQIYRNKNIFPITYYNHYGIIKEILKCVNKNIKWDDTDVLNLKLNQGQSLCRFIFKNLHKVKMINDNRTMWNKFYDDKLLKNSIKFCISHKTCKNPVVPSALKDGLEMSGGTVPTNFKTMNAKALYEKYVPKNGIIYDFACGFGGRMLGALSSKNNYKYLGVEPCKETYNGLIKLGKYIEEATGRNNIYKVFCEGSETFNKYENIADFAFSSPPYFNLEHYSDEYTQCYNKFKTLEEWFKGYVDPTIKNIYKILKPNCYYAVNVADFNINSKHKIELVDR